VVFSFLHDPAFGLGLDAGHLGLLPQLGLVLPTTTAAGGWVGG